MDLGFLDNLVITDRRGFRAPLDKNPSGGLILRVYSNGNTYPSKELVEAFNLEYTNKDAEDQGNYFDIVDSNDWSPMANLPRIILVGVVSRNEGKGDIFRRTHYKEDGTPQMSVMQQGSPYYKLKEICDSLGYFDNDRHYIDLLVSIDHQIKASDNLYFLPKTISKGDKKGEPTYVRRENIQLFPLVPTPEMEVGVEKEKENETT